jgi:hypothetical protein
MPTLPPKGHCRVCGVISYYQCKTCKKAFCSRHLARHQCARKEENREDNGSTTAAVDLS